MTMKKKAFENMAGKGENAGNQHFYPFSHDVFKSIKDKNHYIRIFYFVICKRFKSLLVYKAFVWYRDNPAPNDKSLAVSRMKAFSDNKSNGTQSIKFVFQRIENILGKEAAFSPFPTMFPKGFNSGASKGLTIDIHIYMTCIKI